jgi:hypothetical protein
MLAITAVSYAGFGAVAYLLSRRPIPWDTR